MDIGNEALEDLIEIAKSSQQPRAYEVIATLVKNVSDASDKLMDVNKKLHEIEIISEPEKNLKNMEKLALIILGSCAPRSGPSHSCNLFNLTFYLLALRFI